MEQVLREDCEYYVEKVPDPSLEPPVIITFTIIYGIEFMFGFCGNFLVLYLTCTNRPLQTVQNLFMLNLALSDLIVCLFSLPVTPVTSVYKNWIFGGPMCHTLPWLQGTAVFIATFSLAAIAVDRYCLIVKPHLRKISRKNAKYVMLGLWVAAALVTLPYSWHMKMVQYEGLCGYFCTEEWADDRARRLYTIAVLLLQFFVPFTIMFVCYYKIFATLRMRTRAKLKKLNDRTLILAASMPIMSTMIKINQDDLIDQCRRKCELVSQTRRNVLMLVAAVVVFSVSCLPHNIASVALEFTDRDIFVHNDIDYSYIVSLATHSVAMLNNVANPILYGLLNPNFVEIVHKTCAEWKDSFRRLKRLETMSSNGSVFV